MLAKRAVSSPSIVMSLSAQAEHLKAQGQEVISLALGEPTWPTPPGICQAGIKAIEQGATKYTPASGSQKLKESIVDYTRRWLGFQPKTQEVTVSIGAKYILFSAIQSLCDPGDEVLVPVPYWVSYPSMVAVAQGQLVPLVSRAADHFKITPHLLEQHITPRSKILILNSPNNPSGAVLEKERLEALGDILRKNPHIYVLSDDIYNHLYFQGSIAPHLVQVCPDLRDRVLCINAASKNYSMSGWRVGWAVGQEDIIRAMSNFQSHSVSCASSISQEALAWALRHGDSELEKARKNLMQKRNLAMEHFQNIKGLDCMPPEGAFYIWVGVSSCLGLSYQGKTLRSSKDFVASLLQAESVLCVPGEAFGQEAYVRMHFAVSDEAIITASQRVRRFLQALS